MLARHIQAQNVNPSHASPILAARPPSPAAAPVTRRMHVVLTVLLLGSALVGTAAPARDWGRIEVMRDTWGIPHVFSDTDAGAFYGLGQATAEERGFQMTYALRIIQGRLAEVIGDRPKGNRQDGAVQSDRMMRTWGWGPAARRVADQLDPDTRALLQAYCDGVNDSFATQKATGKLHPLFTKFSIAPELWTTADCLMSWWHLSQFFASDGTRDLMGWRNRVQPEPGRPRPPEESARWRDDSAAVVQLEDTSSEWQQRVRGFADGLGLGSKPASGAGDAPKFSHAWVVGGSRTTTGSAVLVSDPQTPVRNPSLWMEFHLAGARLNARGVGVPGSPGLLVGFNTRVAWGLTALGADQADLFRLETDAAHPDQYRWDGVWRPMTSREERIRVKGGEDVTLRVRETHLGPIASAFAFRRPDDPEVALKRIPICDTNLDTIQAVIGMMRATNAAALQLASRGWRFPSANCVFGDSAGHVGYTVLGAIPIRSARTLEPAGHVAEEGHGAAGDWRGFVPPELLPQIVDPRAGYILSANHRPVASFYPLPLGLSTGSMGDTIRSWRLRERLAEHQGKFTPDDVLAIHFDAVNPARRELVRLGLHVRATQLDALSESARKALDVLGPWLQAGAKSDARQAGADLAQRISTFFRFTATPLTLQFGGGETGLSRYLKDAARRITADAKAALSTDEIAFIDQVLAGAWSEPENTRGAAGRRTGASGLKRPLPSFDSLDGFGSLDPASDLVSPALAVVDGQTIHSQAGQSYTQWVPLHDPDAARTVCPIGHSERLDSPARTSTMELWGKGELHPAPLTRAGVEKIATSRQVLQQRP